jgi:hypothetical protein
LIWIKERRSPFFFLSTLHGQSGAMMKLIEMTVADDSVRMLYATQPKKDDAEQWIEFKVPVKEARSRRIAEVQMQAILQIRSAFDKQMEPPASG